MLKGVIFDWDGVIVDSSAAHKESWEILAQREGLLLPEDHFALTFGRTNHVIIPEILRWADEQEEIYRLGYEKERLYRELLDQRGLVALPGAKEFVQELTRRGIPKAVGTSTPKTNLDHALKLLGLEGAFEAMITAEDVKRGKPDPDVFLKAAAAIGVDPGEAVVFEDAVYGIDAALAGGMKAVAVLGTHDAAKFGHAHWIVQSLAEVTVERLESLWKSTQ